MDSMNQWAPSFARLILPSLAFREANCAKATLIHDFLIVIFPAVVFLLSPNIALTRYLFPLDLSARPLYCPLAPSSVPSPITAPSLSALRFLFSSRLVLLSANSFSCLLSTPVNQYPKLPPAAAKMGYAQSDSLLKKGRISIPSCQNRTARPRLHGTG